MPIKPIAETMGFKYMSFDIRLKIHGSKKHSEMDNIALGRWLFDIGISSSFPKSVVITSRYIPTDKDAIRETMLSGETLNV